MVFDYSKQQIMDNLLHTVVWTIHSSQKDHFNVVLFLMTSKKQYIQYVTHNYGPDVNFSTQIVSIPYARVYQDSKARLTFTSCLPRTMNVVVKTTTICCLGGVGGKDI